MQLPLRFSLILSICFYRLSTLRECLVSWSPYSFQRLPFVGLGIFLITHSPNSQDAPSEPPRGPDTRAELFGYIILPSPISLPAAALADPVPSSSLYQTHLKPHPSLSLCLQKPTRIAASHTDLLTSHKAPESALGVFQGPQHQLEAFRFCRISASLSDVDVPSPNRPICPQSE